MLVENLDAITQIHSYYISNNKSELSYHGTEQIEEEIQQVLRDADLYEDEEEISLNKVMFNDRSNVDDIEIIAKEPLEVEEILNLSKFLQNALGGKEDNNK